MLNRYGYTINNETLLHTKQESELKLMALSIGGSKQKYKGIFINKVTLKSVVDLSHTVLPFIGKEFDLAIKASFDIGKEFLKEITICGNFKRDADGSVASLGGAFKVARFFEELGIKGDLTPTNDLPAEWLTQVVGKECFVLDYLAGVKDNGKGKYYPSDMISTDEDYLINDFMKGVSKGFPKNFVPDALDAGYAPQGDSYEAPVDGVTAPVEEMVF
jgi:hypothetical protein